MQKLISHIYYNNTSKRKPLVYMCVSSPTISLITTSSNSPRMNKLDQRELTIWVEGNLDGDYKDLDNISLITH